MHKNILPAVAMIAVLAMLAGCKDTDRPLSYNKGVYGGKTDQKLNEKQVEALRQRGTLQN